MTDAVMIQSLTPEKIRAFADQLQGRLIQPGEVDYDTARLVWNGMIDKYPALIAQPINVDDVVASVNFARTNAVPVSIRGGGHNVAGSAIRANGLVIDLSAMKHIEVDPKARTVKAQAGATLGDLDAATQQFGLAVPSGVVSETGIAGLTLGGGFGWLRNKYGLTIDNLIGAEMVTADGQVVYTSETENPELLWGLRGGGGELGVVTRFEYRAHPVGPEVMFAFVFYTYDDLAEAKRLINAYYNYAETAPDEVSSLSFLGTIPSGHSFPEDAWGKPFYAIAAIYSDDAADGQRVLQPLRELATPVVDFSEIMPFVEVQKVLDEDYPKHELRYYWKSAYLREMNDVVIDRMLDLWQANPSPLSTIDFWYHGGAMNRVAPDATAYGDRSTKVMLGIESNWSDPADDAANIAWNREFVGGLRDFTTGKQYINFPGFYEEGEAMYEQTFTENYQRLAALKRQYDPQGMFSMSYNHS